MTDSRSSNTLLELADEFEEAIDPSSPSRTVFVSISWANKCIDAMRAVHEPPPEHEWPLITRIKADIVANCFDNREWSAENEDHCATLDLLSEALEVIKKRSHLPPVPARSDEDYAIEHGRYLATAAEQFITSVDEFELATQALEEGTDDETEEELRLAVDNASEAQSDHRNGLANAVYEFRKRADRARPAPTKGEG